MRGETSSYPQGELSEPQPGNRISWPAWAALAWTLIVLPVWLGHFYGLAPGLRELESSGSRTAWLTFWLFSAARAWFGFALCVAAARTERIPLAGIGLGTRHPRIYSALFAVTVVGFLGIILMRHTGSYVPPAIPLESFSQRFQAVFLTASAPELLVLLGRSLTAGICEETLYRGFALVYLNRLFGRMWPGVLLANLSFAYAHYYTGQGLASLAGVFLVGLAYSGVYLWRRSLWPVIFMHFLFDAVQLVVVLPALPGS